MELIDIDTLKKVITKGDTGILFCIGQSFISKIIQAKTRKNIKEVVPSHIALIVDGQFLYESTSQEATLKHKTIPAGVRRYLLTDFFKLERYKGNLYGFLPYEVDRFKLERYIHYPYGKDIILDFVLKDGSDGVSKGLICSQYANKVTGFMDMICPSPADMYRQALKILNGSL